jgi:hypothetical protein
MNKNDVLPPGEHPFDTRRPHTDQVAYALERLQTFLIWIAEHRASFEKERDTDPQNANAELRNLEDSTEQAVLHLQRLTELLLVGYTIDTDKELPKGLCGQVWVRWVQLLRQERKV